MSSPTTSSTLATISPKYYHSTPSSLISSQRFALTHSRDTSGKVIQYNYNKHTELSDELLAVVRPEEERPAGRCSVQLLQEKPCVPEPRLSLVHVKTVRREMAEAAVGVYPKLSMSVALHKIYPPIFPFLINREIKQRCSAAEVLESREDAVAGGGRHPKASQLADVGYNNSKAGGAIQ